jgi:hypothetical protein
LTATRPQTRSGTRAPGRSSYGDLELRARSAESFVAELKPRDVPAFGAKQ